MDDLYLHIISITLLSITIIGLLIFLIIRKIKYKQITNHTQDTINAITKEINELRVKINTEINDFAIKLVNLNHESQNIFQTQLTKQLNERLDSVNVKIDTKFEQSFKDSNDIFIKVNQKLTVIDEAQKAMQEMGRDVISLKDILGNKNTRGSFGEGTLYQILDNIYGSNSEFYQKQKKLDYKIKDNEVRPDALLNYPNPLGVICLDSKFPLDNYQKMINLSVSESDRDVYARNFKNDIKTHITTIREKYIKPPHTAEVAIMFVPSESLYIEITSNFKELVVEANKHNVWITSPSTIVAAIMIIKNAYKNIEINKNALIVKNALDDLSMEFRKFSERWEKLVNSVESLAKSTKEISITSGKIQSRFNTIKNIDIENVVGTDSQEQIEQSNINMEGD